MAARAEPTQPPCGACLIIEPGPTAGAHIAAILARAPIASALIRPAPGRALEPAGVRPLVEDLQTRNVATLLLDDAALARTLKADGVHLSPGVDVLERYEEARSILGQGAIVGVDAGGSRHVAMEAGEAAADYVAFSAAAGLDHDASAGAPQPGEPPALAADDPDGGTLPAPGPRGRDALVAWWSEVFEVPVVAFEAGDADEAAHLARCGADFVAIPLRAGASAEAETARVLAIMAALEDRDAD